jgi:hypothetical protein
MYFSRDLVGCFETIPQTVLPQSLSEAAFRERRRHIGPIQGNVSLSEQREASEGELGCLGCGCQSN